MSDQLALVPQPHIEVSESAAMLSVIAAAAKDPSVDVGKMERMMALYTAMQDREAKVAFAQALNRLEAKIPKIVKTRSIEVKGVSRSKYAALEDIDAQVRPLLIDEGFAVSFSTEPVPGAKDTRVTMTLKHRLGHEEHYSLVLPFDKSDFRTDVQSVGSTLSYGKRYLLCGALHIVTVGEDNDGAGGVLSMQQANNIQSMIDACELRTPSVAKFLTFAGAQSVEQIKATHYDRCMVALKKQLTAKQAGAR